MMLWGAQPQDEEKREIRVSAYFEDLVGKSVVMVAKVQAGRLMSACFHLVLI